MKRDLFKLSAELDGLSMLIIGLSNQLDNDKSDTLTPQSMKDALFGVSMYLNRIAADLGDME